MSFLSALVKGLGGHWIPDQEVRAEAWALGGRHRGEVTEGARRELREPDISARRAVLLRAVIRRQTQ